MKRLSAFLAILILLCVGLVGGLVLGQGETAGGGTGERLFEVYTQIGDLRPQGVQYNREFDLYAMVNIFGELVIVDAQTYETRHTLYPGGTAVSAYRLSHDGRSLAVAIDTRIEIWDTQTGQLVVDLEPDGALAIQRPLYFSDDDELVGFEAVIRAPQAIRRSENDTSILPWVWDVAAAKRERSSRLPGRVQALPFFENRGGVVLGANDLLLAAVVERLRVQKFDTSDLTLTAEVYTGRTETDPLRVWGSLVDDESASLYIQRENDLGITQINTRTGETIDLLAGQRLTAPLVESIGGIVFNRQSRIIGEAYSTATTSLGEYLLGDNYPANYEFHPLTITLIDILRPVTFRPDSFAFLVHVQDEQTGYGQVQLILTDVQELAISPDETRLLVRRIENDQRLELYDLASGALVRSYIPGTRDLSLAHEMDFDATGTIIVTDFERIDVATGEVLNQELNYISGFNSVYFSDDSTQMAVLRSTERGEEWYLWDIASKQILARETLRINGSLISTWRNGQQFLSILDGGTAVEVYNVATGDRRQLQFEGLPGRAIIDILPSRDWQHYFVIYSENANNAYAPGNAVAMYSLDHGKLWVIADDDLPSTSSRQYGWVDNQTVYIYSDPFSDGQPRRIYGIDYHESTLPQCLADAFPDDYMQWAELWERFATTLRVDMLNRLALDVCALVANGGDAAAVDGLFFPTPRPTLPYSTPTPAVIAGVPACLTLRFPAQALDYTEDWRAIIEGLTPAQVDELSTLLCESLTGDGTIPEGFNFTPPQVMTIDVQTGARSLGTYIPTTPRTALNTRIIADAFFRVEGRELNGPVLSPDGQYITEFTFDGNITVWRVLEPYEAFIDDVTATVVSRVTEQNLIAVQPTQTLPFTPIGTARPTLTPTMTLTSPPRPTEYLEQAQRDDVIEMCAYAQPLDARLFTVSNLPGDWSPGGRLIIPPIRDYTFGQFIEQPTATATRPTAVPPTYTPLPDQPTITPSRTPRPEDLVPTATPTFSVEAMSPVRERYTNSLWFMSPVDGALTIADGVPACNVSVSCAFSFDRRWVLYETSRGVYVLRPDGRDAFQLVDNTLRDPAPPQNFSWTGADTLEFTTFIKGRQFDPDGVTDERRQLRPQDVLDAGGVSPNVLDSDAIVTVPRGWREEVYINDLYANRAVDLQPGGGSITVMYTTYNTGFGTGYKYYLYDARTGESAFFARTTEQLYFEWHPLGTLLFYRYPDQDLWYVYDVTAGEHRRFGQIPEGIWSPDGRYKVTWYYASEEELQQDIETEQPTPKLSIWDLETGLTRRYCIAQTGREVFRSDLLWSPDSRYLALYLVLPEDVNDEVTPRRLLLLDTETGAVVDLGFDVDFPISWVEDAANAGGTGR